MRTSHSACRSIAVAAAVVAAALLPVGPASAQGTPSSPAATTRSDMATKLPRADAKMLNDIAQANAAEIATGKLALEKSQNDQVKKFAQMMIDDHTKGLSEVQALAQSKGVDVPDEPDLKHKAAALQLRALSGESFDSRYIKQVGVGDHQATVKLLTATRTNAKDADVKALATKMLPIVQAHLEHAKSMAKR